MSPHRASCLRPCKPYVSLVGLPNFFAINPFWMFDTSFYSVEPAASDAGRAGRRRPASANRTARPHLVLTATNVREGQLETFRSTERRLSLDHVIASGSLPPRSRLTTIDDVAYWDGGLFDNTPLGALIDMLEGDDRAVAVVNLFPNRIDQLPRSMADVGQHSLNLLFANKTASDVKLMTRFNAVAELVADLEKLPTDSPVRDWPSFKAVLEADYKRVPAIVEITRSRPAQQLEASDFSHTGIERRAGEGQRGRARCAAGEGLSLVQGAYTHIDPVKRAIASPTGSISRAPVLRTFKLHHVVGEVLRADDDLVGQADKIEAGELGAGAVLRVVVEHIDLGLAQLAVDAGAGGVGSRVADLQVGEPDPEGRPPLPAQTMPASSWLASMIAPARRETPDAVGAAMRGALGAVRAGDQRLHRFVYLSPK